MNRLMLPLKKGMVMNMRGIRSIKGRMICALLMLSMIPLLVLGISSYQVSKREIVLQAEQIHGYNIDTYDKNITIAFENLRRAAKDLLYGKRDYETGKIVALLEEKDGYYESLSIYRQYETKMSLSNQIAMMVPYNIHANEVILDNRRGFCYSQRMEDSGEYNRIVTGEINTEYEELFQAALAKDNKEIFARWNEDTFAYMKIIYSLKTFQPIGYLMLQVESDILQSILPAGDELEDVAYVVVDAEYGQEPRIVFSSGNLTGIDRLVSAYYRGELNEIKDWKVGSKKNEASAWDILYIADRKALAKRSEAINTVTVTLMAVISGMIVILAFWIGRMINRPLERLRGVIRKVGETGDYTIKEQFGEDEIGRIGNQFKQMVEQNLTLKECLYQAQIKHKEAELIALQAQINPHFLYNTLDAIYLMTQMGRTLDAGKMTLALSEIFRTSLSKGQEFIRVRDEVRYIENYLYIQKMRYGERIAYTISVEEEIFDEKILKLVLQPIIENAIYHGLEPKPGNGRLWINGCRGDGHIIFCVKDNGVGMEGEGWKTGYGLTNVRERLKLYYGSAYDLKVKSTPGKGTQMEVRIPVQLENRTWDMNK